MSKTIAFLADGTWNGVKVDSDKDGVLESTNVLKLYHNLAGDDSIESFTLADEGERAALDADRNTVQIAKYLHGVGDSDNAIIKLLGGAFGAGIISRIVRGYTFISRNYQPGDRIVIAGFSRGAYTARALGGMIAKAGLMDYAKFNFADKEQAYQCGLYVWAYYRERQQKNLAERAVDLVWRRVLGIGTEVGQEQMIPNVPVAAIGVWDTVGSLGIPVYDATEDKRLDLFRFADAELSGKVAQGFHALAIDEHRADFTPTPWNARSGIEQVWFAGAHADVGGGYEESGLSDFGLAWMVDRLGTAGLQYKDPLPLLPAGDVSGELHDSWNALPYKLKPPYLRPIAPDAKVHRSVQQHRAALAAYQPGNLVNWAGQYVQ